jgi:hypothetical protein
VAQFSNLSLPFTALKFLPKTIRWAKRNSGNPMQLSPGDHVLAVIATLVQSRSFHRIWKPDPQLVKYRRP